MAAAIRFMPFAGRRVAYEVRGDGPALVVPVWWVSHLELQWQEPAFRDFWDAVADGFTLVRYDRLGVGLSDRGLTAADIGLEPDVETLHALVDHLGLDRCTLVAGSSGGCTAIAFAARFPERVDRLVLFGVFADGAAIAPPEVRESLVSLVRSHWGLGSRVLADVFLADASAGELVWLARLQREAADADTAAALFELVYRLDVRAELARVEAPAIVLHRRRDRTIPYALGREVAAGLPAGTLVPLDGTEHFPWRGDSASVVRAVRSFLGVEAQAAAPVPVGDHDLSRRELEVLRLVARGLSDAEIAEQLVVSPHTVHRHVANIRRKLGQASRAAAVAEAARLGLL
jgi:pimeloyl-ACP methyl ester carboxylesterase/DNA-binding CsgD family transcriptional regulator